MTEEQLEAFGWRKHSWDTGVFYTKFCQVDNQFERCLKSNEENGSLSGYGFTIYTPEQLAEFEETRILPQFWIAGLTPPIDIKELKNGECLVQIWWDESEKCYMLHSKWFDASGKRWGSTPIKLNRQFLMRSQLNEELKKLE